MGRLIRFRVVDAHRKPLTSGQVESIHEPSGQVISSLWVPNDRGVMLTSFDTGDHTVTVRVFGQGTETGTIAEQRITAATHSDKVIELRLRRDPSRCSDVVIHVTDRSGRPVARALVGVFSDVYELLGTGARTDRSGRARCELRVTWPVLLERRMLAYAWAPGFAIGYAVREAGLDRDSAMTVILVPGASIAGVVRGDQPITRFWLEPVHRDAKHHSCNIGVVVDCRGRFRAHGLGIGPHRIVTAATADRVLSCRYKGDPELVIAPRKQPASPPWSAIVDVIDVRSDGDSAVVEVSHAHREVVGHVADETRMPVADAAIEIRALGLDDLGEVVHRTSTDGTGRFAIAIPPSDQISVRAFHPAFGRELGMSEHRHTYQGTPRAMIELVLRRGVRLAGRVVDSSGSPRAHDRLYLMLPYIGSGPSFQRLETDEAGGFDLGIVSFATGAMLMREANYRTTPYGGVALRESDFAEQRPTITL
jgi:hypothetical protein